MSKRNPLVVSASEIASWSYCPEAWQLQSTGHAPGNQDDLGEGKRRHAETASIEVQSGAALKFGRGLLVSAVLILALLGFLLVRGR